MRARKTGDKRTEYSFATPVALERIAAVLAVIELHPGTPATSIAHACHMSATTTCTYLTHLAEQNRAHSVTPDKGKGQRWYAGPNPGAQPARRKIKGERIVNIVRAQDCRLPAFVDPMRAFLFGR